MSPINIVKDTNRLNSIPVGDNETMSIVCFYGDGGRNDEEISRHRKVMEMHKKVFEHYNIPINYIYHNFNYSGLGSILDHYVGKILLQQVDYVIHIDIDCIPLRADFHKIIFEKIKDKKTIFGMAQQSNHIVVNGQKNHVYCGSSGFAISSKLYKELGSPSFEYTDRGDICEEITWLVEERGYNMCMVYPKHFYETTKEEQEKCGVSQYYDLGVGHKWGLGGTFGDLYFHATMQSVPRSSELFIDKCKQIIEK
jgi:hypothetical protein